MECTICYHRITQGKHKTKNQNPLGLVCKCATGVTRRYCLRCCRKLFQSGPVECVYCRGATEIRWRHPQMRHAVVPESTPPTPTRMERCPNCRELYEKMGGCDNMKCLICGQRFIWGQGWLAILTSADMSWWLSILSGLVTLLLHQPQDLGLIMMGAFLFSVLMNRFVLWSNLTRTISFQRQRYISRVMRHFIFILTLLLVCLACFRVDMYSLALEQKTEMEAFITGATMCLTFATLYGLFSI